MKLLLFHAQRRLYILLIGIVLFDIVYIFQPGMSVYFFIYGIDSAGILITALIGAFVLSNSAEVELCKCYGLPLPSLLTAQTLPVFLYTSVTMAPIVLLYKLEGITLLMHIQLAVSVGVTLMFFLSLAVFIRAAIRNTYAVIGFFMVIYWPVSSFHEKCRVKLVPESSYVFDVFLSSFMFQDKFGPVPIYRWLINRAAVLLIAVALYVSACFLVSSKRFEDYK